MAENELTQLFGGQKVRTKWDEEKQKWYFSIVDVCGVLTDSKDPQAYWRKLKQRLKDEGNETVTNCHALKMMAADGKMRSTDVADMEQMFRLIESIPSKKAEPFKQWMAEVARKGGKIAGDARKKLEAQTGHSVITRDKASDYLPPADRIQELPEKTDE